MKIEFEYPSAWQESFKEQQLSYHYIFFLDPTKPTPQNEELDPDQGLVVLAVKRISPANFSLEEEVRDWKQDMSDYAELLEEQLLEIDGYPAQQLFYRIGTSTTGKHSVPLMNRLIFLLAEDRFYIFSLRMPEAERGGEFEQSFDHLIGNIAIIK